MLLIIAAMSKQTLPESKTIAFDTIESEFTKTFHKSDLENLNFIKSSFKDISNPLIKYQLLINEKPLQSAYECTGPSIKTKYIILDFGHDSANPGYYYSSRKEFEYLDKALFEMFKTRKIEFLSLISNAVAQSDLLLQSNINDAERKSKNSNSTLISFHAMNPEMPYYHMKIIYVQGSEKLACFLANEYINKGFVVELLEKSRVTFSSHYDILDSLYINKVLIELGELNMDIEDFKQYAQDFIFEPTAKAISDYWK